MSVFAHHLLLRPHKRACGEVKVRSGSRENSSMGQSNIAMGASQITNLWRGLRPGHILPLPLQQLDRRRSYG